MSKMTKVGQMVAMGSVFSILTVGCNENIKNTQTKVESTIEKRSVGKVVQEIVSLDNAHDILGSSFRRFPEYQKLEKLENKQSSWEKLTATELQELEWVKKRILLIAGIVKTWNELLDSASIEARRTDAYHDLADALEQFQSSVLSDFSHLEEKIRNFRKVL